MTYHEKITRFEAWYESECKDFVNSNLEELTEDQISTLMWLAYARAHQDTVDDWRSTLQETANKILGSVG